MKFCRNLLQYLAVVALSSALLTEVYFFHRYLFPLRGFVVRSQNARMKGIGGQTDSQKLLESNCLKAVYHD